MRLKFPFLSAFVCTALLLLGCEKDDPDRQQIDLKELPATAQTFIGRYFPDGTVHVITISPNPPADYEVVFTNGDDIRFDHKGDWIEVDCLFTRVPDEIVPVPILAHVHETFPDISIIEIEKLPNGAGYEVNLSNARELVYDAAGKFIRYDD